MLKGKAEASGLWPLIVPVMPQLFMVVGFFRVSFISSFDVQRSRPPVAGRG